MTRLAPARPALVERLHRFVDELRDRGLPVSMVERIDAMRAVETGRLWNSPHGLHTALAATLVKAAEHLSVFDEVFGLYFRSDRRSPERGRRRRAQRATTAPAPLDLDLEHAVRTVLRDGSDALARKVAEQAVPAFARFEAGASGGRSHVRARTVAGAAHELDNRRPAAPERTAAGSDR